MLNDNIKAYRKFKGWTQEKMAVEFEITRDNVASYERGLAKPSLEFACKICDDLRVSIHTLLYGEILNPKIESVSLEGSRVGDLENELVKAYDMIATLSNKKMMEILNAKNQESELSKVAEDEKETGKRNK